MIKTPLLIFLLAAPLLISLPNCNDPSGSNNAALPTERVTNFEGDFVVNSVMLAWTNPTDSNFDHVVIIRNSSRAPTDIDDGTEVYSGSESSFADTGASSSSVNYYAIYTCNASDECMTLGETTSVDPNE